MSHKTTYEKLLKISGDPIVAGSPPVEGRARSLVTFADRGRELLSLLEARNGFFAFESCLLVRPVGSNVVPRGIDEWNVPTLWQTEYSLTSEALFFAEDVFGHQFAIRGDAIEKFDPETGEFERFVASIPEWVEAVLQDYEYETGYSVGHRWQTRNGPLPVGRRLCPKVPFVCGGEFDIGNLVSVDEVKGMLCRANLARQLRECPDGTQIVFEIID